MIQIGKSEPNDVEDIKVFLEGLDVKYNLDIQTAYILKDGRDIRGVSIFSDKKEVASIDVLFIDENYRGISFGDGLLRATFNYLMSRGHEVVTILENININAFLKAEGLTYIQKNNDIGYFQVLISDFFEKPCKSTRC